MKISLLILKFIVISIADMELKKNPEVEVGRFGTLYFEVGLCIMMLFTYLALEYKSYRPIITSIETVPYEENYDSRFEEEIPVMRIKTPATSAPLIAIGLDGIKVVDDLELIDETYMESTEAGQMDVIGKVVENQTPILRVEDVVVKEVEEDVEIPFAAIESAPVFPGCEKGSLDEIKACFQKKLQQHINANFVYPQAAIDREIYGRVFVLFAIDKDGNVVNVRSRGPDKLLENEAERIIGLLPKMTPGKQRGKPVRVTYSLPIYFKYTTI